MTLKESGLQPLNSGGSGKSTEKLYYSISEVAKLTGLEQHVIRYWESEFPKLRPKKNRAGNRQFKQKDIQIIRYIKHLLYHDMYTVQGAKKRLAESGYKEVEGQLNLLSALPSSSPAIPSEPEHPSIAPSLGTSNLLPNIIQELREVKKLLETG